MPQPHRVVIIEDDGDLRGLVAAVLSQAGYRVGATGDARQSVDLVRQEQPELILCDIAMPDMDGYAVVRALQSDPATRSVPVVFLTGRREFADRVRAFRSGVVDYITKPVTSESLLSRVGDIVGGSNRRAADGETAILLGSDLSSPLMRREGDEPTVIDDGTILSDPSGAPVPDFSEVPAALREIVIADDDPAYRSALAAVFARYGFRVRETANGIETVRRVLETPPALLLVDVRMPALDGFEVCRQLRACDLTQRLPIVFLSGYDEYESRAAGLEAGANEFLSKRTPLRELLLRVQLQLSLAGKPPVAASAP